MATPEPTLHKLLMDTLDDLSNDNLDRFNFFLTDRGLLSGFKLIPEHKLKNANRTQILKTMMATYGHHTITVIKRVLEHVSRNDLLEKLFAFNPEGKACECVK